MNGSPRRRARVPLVPAALGLAIGAICAGTVFADTAAVPERLHAWSSMDWVFPSDEARRAFIEAEVHRRAPLAGVEADAAGTVYVTTPRWLDPAVPSTLSRVTVVDGEPLLEPFPSWAAHDLSDPDAIRNALGVYVDGRNRMWIVDMGWVAGEDLAPEGTQKLIAIDLGTGEEIRRIALPDDVAPRNTSLLNDIVVDDEAEIAYLTDSGNRGGTPVPAALIVVDLESGKARRVLDGHASVQDDPDAWLAVDGRPVFDGERLAVGVNGVALSADRETLHWSVTTGDAVYSAPTRHLLDADATSDEVAASVSAPLRIGGGSDGIATDPQGRLWITNLTLNRVEVLEPGATRPDVLVEGADFVWPDSLANDFAGGMLLSTNRLNTAFDGSMVFDDDTVNFAVWRLPADVTSQP